MMLEFSTLCMSRLNNHLPLRLFFAPLQPFFNANVHKEIEKDHLVIKHAAAVFETGKSRGEINVDDLFELTKDIDRQFLGKLANPFFSIQIRYDDFAEIRKKRIDAFVDLAFSLLDTWEAQTSFKQAVKSTFSEASFREVLGEVLHLYNVETRMLSKSATFTDPAGRVKELFSEKLFTTMEKTARDISTVYARKTFTG